MLHAELLSALVVARRRDLQEHATTRWCLGHLARRRPRSRNLKAPRIRGSEDGPDR